jgi:hypothetical protein
MCSLPQIEILDYPDPIRRSSELGLNAPTHIALLPRNFLEAQSKADLVLESSTPTVRILWRQAGIRETPLENDGERLPTIEERGLPDWIAPTIFLGSTMLNQGQILLTLALNVISNYLYDLLKHQDDTGVKLDIVVEKRRGSEYKMIRYRGPVEGMDQLPAVIMRASSDGEPGESAG